jgi:hypothetical protein
LILAARPVSYGCGNESAGHGSPGK